MKEGMSMADDKKALAYQLGMQSGIQLQTRLFPQVEGQVFAGDSTKHLSAKNVLAGMIDGKNGVSALIVGKDTLHREQAGMYMQQKMQAMAAKANEKVYGAAKKANEEFIAKIAKTAGVKALPGGVYYKEVKAGTGATPKADQICEVSYEGRLMNGKVFDSSQDKTVKFPANQVIKGWTIALTNMKVGSEWEVYIPWNLAYGDEEQGPIPPYSALVFKIKLVSVSDAPAQPEAPQMQKGM
jgi:peptidyl-prolyl cis-trans isomerase